MMNLYMYTTVISMTVFGLTDAVVRLSTMKGVSQTLFVGSLIASTVISYVINQLARKPGFKLALWKHKGRLLLVDLAMYCVISIVSYWSLNARYLIFSTIAVVNGQLVMIMWEYVKELKGDGVSLNSNREAKGTLGLMIGSVTWVILDWFGYTVSLPLALILQVAALTLETAAFYYVIRRM